MDNIKMTRMFILLKARFFLFCYNSTTPKLSFFNGTKELSLFSRKISFSPLKPISDGIFLSITSLSSLQINNPKHQEIDLCLNVAKFTLWVFILSSKHYCIPKPLINISVQYNFLYCELTLNFFLGNCFDK